MPRLSHAFKLHKTQAELDFVDVPLHTDVPLFIDPFAISQRVDRWSQEAHRLLVCYFQEIVDRIRSEDTTRVRDLLRHLREPNETRLGFSSGKPQGAGIGESQAQEIFDALRDSTAVKTGFISNLEECELMIEGIGPDKISDLTTNILRRHLITYSQEQCRLHDIEMKAVPAPPCFDDQSMQWRSEYVELPVWRNQGVVLVPKAIVRFDPAYDHQKYYRHCVLNYLQAEHLANGSSLVRTLRNGRQRVYKKDLEAVYPCSKAFLYQFSRDHPEVLRRYREELARVECSATYALRAEDEAVVAAALREALHAIPAGDGGYRDYHSLMVGTLEFLFFPDLLCPKKEAEIHQGRKRIDIIMENGAREAIFWELHQVRKLPCAYVAIECKNYSTDVANPELDQLSGRFGVNRGQLGFLCCRRFEARNLFVERCRDTLRDGRGLIIPFDDEQVRELLDLVEAGRRREVRNVVRRLVTDVWLA